MVQTELATRPTLNRLKSISLFFYHLFEGLFWCLIPDRFHPKKDVQGKTVLVTGAGSGIGQLIALKFLRLGCKVVIWDMSTDGLNKTIQLARQQKLDDKKIFFYQINLVDRDAIYEVAKRVRNEVGVVDILINNAGIVTGNFFLDNSDEKMLQTFQVNVFSHFYTIKAFLPDMIKQKSGHIVTVASVAGHVVASRLTDYCSSKFANVGFELALRTELAHANLDKTIKTSIVKPYLISTGMFSGANAGLLPFLEPEYVAHRVVEGVLINKSEIIIPRHVAILFVLGLVLPPYALLMLFDFIGGWDSMTQFHGRQSNNNNNNNNNNNTNAKKFK